MKNILLKAAPAAALLSLCCLMASGQNEHRIQSSNKTITGMTAGGGTHGYGVVYHFNTGTGKDTIPWNTIEYQAGGSAFGMPRGSTLLKAKDGQFYGMSQFGGIFGMGCMFRFNPTTNTDTIVASCTWTNGYCPRGPLMQASNGLIYGMAQWGGSAGLGVLFYYNPATGQDSVMVSFNGANGSNPYYSKLVQTPNGKLYGMTQQGGTYKLGVLFSFDPATKAETVLANFNDTNGKNPYGGLMLANDGNLYGVSTYGGGAINHDSGTLFRFNPSTNVLTVLYNFRKMTGGIPAGSLMQVKNGLLYGSCNSGGKYNNGVLYCFNYNTSKDSVVINFNDTNGRAPNGDNNVIQGTDGYLYGTTAGGGNTFYPYGVLYRYDPVSGKDSVLVNFTTGLAGGAPGAYPFDAVMEDTTLHILYGLTQQGGNFVNGGTVFSYHMNTRSYNLLANLGGSSSNEGCLMQASNGMLYGVTGYGGSKSLGTVFEYDPTNDVATIQHPFTGTDGLAPYGMLTEANDGYLYGVTSHGDTNLGAWGDFFGHGILYKFNPANNQVTYLHNFGQGSLSGTFPFSSLIQATDNNLYGSTLKGGTYNRGTLYRYNPVTTADSAVVIFNDTNGANPIGGVVQASNKLVYGMTTLGGTNNMGVLYYYNPSTLKDSVMFSFTGPNGANPFAELIQCTADNNLYGMTSKGGTSNNGVIFRYNPVTKQDTVVLNFSGTDGAHPYNTLIQDSAGNLYGTTRFGGAHSQGVLFEFNPKTKVQNVLLNFSADSGEFPCNILFTSSAPNGIASIRKQQGMVVVYPNPFTEAATVLFTESGKHTVEIDDMNGEKLSTFTATGKQCTIPRNNMPAGVYLVKIYDESGRYQSSVRIVTQ